MRAIASEAGALRKCPKCEAKFRIPKPGAASKPAASPKVKAKSDTPKRRIPKPKKKKEEDVVPVVCGICNTRVYAKLAQVGTTVECPDCYTQNMVKPPTEKTKKGPPAMMGDGYGLAPQQEISIIESMGKDRLEVAEEIVQKQIEEAPKMPDKPFMSGVVTYPFRVRVFPIVLGLAMAWSFLVIGLSFAWSLEGFASAVAPVLLAGIGIAGVMVLVPTLVSFQKIMENSSNGDDESDIRPDGGMFTVVESFFDVVPLILAASFSCVPTLGIVTLAGLDEPFRVAAAYCAFMLFPFVLLSMMEHSSILGVVSKNVWGSLTKIPGAWFKFGLIATALFAAVAGIIVGVVTFDVSQLSVTPLFFFLVVVIFAVFCLVTVYFRLLGRLVFVMSQKVWIKVNDKPQKETKSSEDLGISASI